MASQIQTEKNIYVLGDKQVVGAKNLQIFTIHRDARPGAATPAPAAIPRPDADRYGALRSTAVKRHPHAVRFGLFHRNLRAGCKQTGKRATQSRQTRHGDLGAGRVRKHCAPWAVRSIVFARDAGSILSRRRASSPGRDQMCRSPRQSSACRGQDRPDRRRPPR